MTSGAVVGRRCVVKHTGRSKLFRFARRSLGIFLEEDDMERHTGRREVFMTRLARRTFLAVLIVLLTSITWGCSSMIANMGVSGRYELTSPQTRAEVRDLFGHADETGTCPDGRVVERFWIRQKIVWLDGCAPDFRGTRCELLKDAYQGSYGLVEIFALPVNLYRSERAKLHYAFVYDKEDRVLYSYDLKTSPQRRFDDVMVPFSRAMYAQLTGGECNAWTRCLAEYAQEVRQRAACVGYALAPEEEQKLERMVAIGEAVDAGRIPHQEGMANIYLLTPLTTNVLPSPPRE
jgi:hypothetical protein